jgi:hypothetical protein
MHFLRVSRTRMVVVSIAALLLAIGVYAYAASNTVPGSDAGAGSGAISGYTVSSVAYGLNATTPTNLDSVTFTIAPTAAGTVKVQLAGGGIWYTCSNSSGSVTCNTTSPQATVAAATQLAVVATS